MVCIGPLIMKYSFSTKSFYDPRLFAIEDLPKDCVDLSEAEYSSLMSSLSQNRTIIDQGGKPFAIETVPDPLTREQIEANRLRAYADPLTGSDRFFAEAARLQVMGGSDSEINAAKESGTSRYAEIQAENPWPAI